MITAVLGDRTLELAAETPYRQAAKEAFRHFGTSEGTVKIYAGGQHVKSFRGGGWDADSTYDIQEAGLTTESPPPSGNKFNSWQNKDTLTPLAEHNHWVRLWEGIVQPKYGPTPNLHRYTMFMKLPDSTDILVVRDRATTFDNTGRTELKDKGPRYKYKTVRYQEVVFDLKSSTFTIARKGDTFKISDDTPQRYPAVHSLLNMIFRHKNLQNDKTIVSLRKDEMAALAPRFTDEILQQICAPFLGQRYSWTPGKGTLQAYNPKPIHSESAPLLIECPHIATVREDVYNKTNTNVLPWFGAMLGSKFNKNQTLARNTPMDDEDRTTIDKDQKSSNVKITYDHGNIRLGWKDRQLFLRHTDLEVDTTPREAEQFEKTGTIPWPDAAGPAMKDERKAFAIKLNARHQDFLKTIHRTETLHSSNFAEQGPYTVGSTVTTVMHYPNDPMTTITVDGVELPFPPQPEFYQRVKEYQQAFKIEQDKWLPYVQPVFKQDEQ